MRGARFVERCWVSVAGVEEGEVVVVRAGGVYVVGTVLDDWYVVSADAVRRLLAKLLGAGKENVSPEC